MDAVLARTLKKITPSPREEEEIDSAIETIIKSVEKNIGKLSFTLAGSYTRGTWMKDKKEIDVFLLFPEYTKRETLEKQGLILGKKIVRSLKGKSRVAYAEHPYTRATFQGYEIDIVPCYKLKDAREIKSSVDRTPFHNQYLSKSFDSDLAGEVRLLKQMLKANYLYGSDTRTEGFSGYLCELLILNYKSFKNLVTAASAWEPGVFIDIEKHHLEKPSFPGQPLITIDPVDPKRNVSAVLSPANFISFVSLCRLFLKKPSDRFFFLKPRKPSVSSLKTKMKSRGTHFLGIEFPSPGVIDDVLYPQLRRTARRLSSLLKEKDFVVLNEDVFVGSKCLILLELVVWELPRIRKLIGPPVFIKKRSKEFVSKYKSARLLVEGENWAAETEREFTRADSLLKATLNVSEARLKELGIASYVAKFMKGFSLLHGDGIARKASSRDFFEFITRYFEKRIEAPQL